MKIQYLIENTNKIDTSHVSYSHCDKVPSWLVGRYVKTSAGDSTKDVYCAKMFPTKSSADRQCNRLNAKYCHGGTYFTDTETSSAYRYPDNIATEYKRYAPVYRVRAVQISVEVVEVDE